MIRCTFSIDGKSFEPESEFRDMGKVFITPEPVTALKMMTTFFVQDIFKFFNVTYDGLYSN